MHACVNQRIHEYSKTSLCSLCVQDLFPGHRCPAHKHYYDLQSWQLGGRLFGEGHVAVKLHAINVQSLGCHPSSRHDHGDTRFNVGEIVGLKLRALDFTLSCSSLVQHAAPTIRKCSTYLRFDLFLSTSRPSTINGD